MQVYEDRSMVVAVVQGIVSSSTVNTAVYNTVAHQDKAIISAAAQQMFKLPAIMVQYILAIGHREISSYGKEQIHCHGRKV